MTVVMRKWLAVIACLAALAAAGRLQGLAQSGAPPVQLPAQSQAQPRHSAEELFLRLGAVGLDASRAYHVREAHIDRPGFYLTLEDGTIAFTEDVLGHVTGALFEGEGDVLVVPPDRAERSSLALFTGAAVLEEKFTFGYFRFNDGIYDDVRPYLTNTPDAAAFVSKWASGAPDFAAADALRLLTTYGALLPSSESSPITNAGAPDRFLHARLRGVKLGLFDLVYDSLSPEQVQVLQFTQTQGDSYYNIWMSFNPRAHGGAAIAKEEPGADRFAIPSYKIQARVTPPRRLEADATLALHVLGDGQRTFLFELSRYLHVASVEADGVALEFIHNPAVDGSQLARQGNDLIAVIFPRTLRSGEQVTLRFAYGGDVLSEEANGLLSVGARGTWYPNRGLRMADFDLNFSYPEGWTLLATGARSEPGIAPSAGDPAPGSGEQHSHWTTQRPIPVAGFNLGRYVKATARAGRTLVEAYATGEMGLAAPKTTASGSVPEKNLPTSSTPLARFALNSSPARNVQAVADRAAEAVDFFASHFGDYPYQSLALTQAPGPVSQGWPGLVFLSGYAFLAPEQLASHNLNPTEVVLVRQTPAHETAHQWWGDLVMWRSYRDQWFSEGLASYCAVLELEEKDPAAFQLVMGTYRDSLLQVKDGRRLSDAGAVTLGQRLNSSYFPGGYDVIAYGRGAWLFHMLREMLRDDETLSSRDSPQAPHEELFMQVLRRVQEKYAGKSLSTRELLQEFEARWPKSLWFEGKPSLDWFWDGWIQGNSVPLLELKGVKILRQKEAVWATGRIAQSLAPDDLVTPVPIYAEGAGKIPVLLGRVFVDGPETSFRLRVPPGTRKVLLDPLETVLRER